MSKTEKQFASKLYTMNILKNPAAIPNYLYIED